MSGPIERISLTIPENLVNELDEIVDSSGYGSRSKATRDAIRGFITDYSWQHDSGKKFQGSLTLVYDHHAVGVNDKLMKIQHASADIIVSTQHVHFDQDQCLETLVLSGRGDKIRELVNELKAIKGMKRVQVTAV